MVAVINCQNAEYVRTKENGRFFDSRRYHERDNNEGSGGADPRRGEEVANCSGENNRKGIANKYQQGKRRVSL